MAQLETSANLEAAQNAERERSWDGFEQVKLDEQARLTQESLESDQAALEALFEPRWMVALTANGIQNLVFKTLDSVQDAPEKLGAFTPMDNIERLTWEKRQHERVRHIQEMKENSNQSILIAQGYKHSLETAGTFLRSQLDNTRSQIEATKDAQNRFGKFRADRKIRHLEQV